ARKDSSPWRNSASSRPSCRTIRNKPRARPPARAGGRVCLKQAYQASLFVEPVAAGRLAHAGELLDIVAEPDRRAGISRQGLKPPHRAHDAERIVADAGLLGLRTVVLGSVASIRRQDDARLAPQRNLQPQHAARMAGPEVHQPHALDDILIRLLARDLAPVQLRLDDRLQILERIRRAMILQCILPERAGELVLMHNDLRL